MNTGYASEPPKGFCVFFRLTFTTQKQQAGENVDIGLCDKRLYRQVDGSEHLCFTHDPPADVFCCWIAQNAIGQNDAHATSTRLDPPDASLDKKDFRGNATL
jgi:hypothetical protein